MYCQKGFGDASARGSDNEGVIVLTGDVRINNDETLNRQSVMERQNGESQGLG